MSNDRDDQHFSEGLKNLYSKDYGDPKPPKPSTLWAIAMWIIAIALVAHLVASVLTGDLTIDIFG